MLSKRLVAEHEWTVKAIERQKAAHPEKMFWIGAARWGGHGDYLNLAAFGRAAQRHWGGGRPLGVALVAQVTTEQTDRDISLGQPGIDFSVHCGQRERRAQVMAIAPLFDVFYEVNYVVRTHFRDKRIWATEQAEADAALDYFRVHHETFPRSGNALGLLGYTMWEVMSMSSGIEVTEADLAVPLAHNFKASWPKPYVTFHNGEGHGVTKTLPIDVAQAIVSAVKALGVTVVQVGVKDDAREPLMADAVDARGLRMHETAKAIEGAMLHFDVEGGLRWVALAVKTKPVTWYACTPPWFFGSDKEVAVSRLVCEPCWWSNEAWFFACPKGFKSCVNLPDAATCAAIAVEHVEKALAGKK